MVCCVISALLKFYFDLQRYDIDKVSSEIIYPSTKSKYEYIKQEFYQNCELFL